MIPIKSKFPDAGTTIFTVMSSLAMEHNAINLGQGFPDFPMDATLIELVADAMKSGMNQYTHMNGLPILREGIAEKVERIYQHKINPETQVTVTPGATYGIYTALTTFLYPGDEVILFEPAYDSYIPNIEINGAVPIRISLNFPDYSIPWDEVEAKINSKTKMIMLNTPHNPTGSVWSDADIQKLKELVNDTSILILSDEVYEHLIYDDKKHLSILKEPELLKRSIVCFSFGKTYHCTGWKLGYCISSPELMKEFRKVHQFNAFTCDTPKQAALAEYIKNEDAYIGLGKFIQQKRDYFRSLMNTSVFEYIPSYGSYFECYSYANFSEESDKDLAIRLTKEYGVATIPVSSFYKDGKDDKILRFCFAKKEETLEKAAERLLKIK